MPDDRKRIAGIVTEYRRHSHADVILGKVLEGYFHDGQDRPQLRLVSLYVDQTPGGDLSRALAKQHGFIGNVLCHIVFIHLLDRELAGLGLDSVPRAVLVT